MSDPLVPTDRPVTMAVPPPSLIRAAAAAPLPDATPDFGTPNIVMTPVASLKLGLAKVIATSVAAMPVVPISNVAALALPSMAEITAAIRDDFNVAA